MTRMSLSTDSNLHPCHLIFIFRNLSSITRIHQASSDFRKGRIWPPAHTQLMYLWDQVRYTFFTYIKTRL
jgi:hypothetical protein